MDNIMSSKIQRGPLRIIDTPTVVDCTRDVGSRRSFRTLLECVVPYCCAFQPSSVDFLDSASTDSATIHRRPSSTMVTGTFFGHRRGRVSFCLHSDARAATSTPLLLLEFTVQTAYLAREMQHGLLRIALECVRTTRARSSSSSCSLFDIPVWCMCCNGRKVGFAVRRQMSEGDMAIFKIMQLVSVGAGVLPAGDSDNSRDGGLMYLRARFQRVVGSVDSESFHLINPVGSTGQQLSIFLSRNN